MILIFLPEKGMGVVFEGKMPMGKHTGRWEDVFWRDVPGTKLEDGSKEKRKSEEGDREGHGLKTDRSDAEEEEE